MRPIPSRPRAALALLLSGLAGACGWFDDPSPEEARLVVQGDAGTPVRIIVSNRFVGSTDQMGTTHVEIFVADTFDVVPPFDRTWAIRTEQRFFSQVEHLDTPSAVRVRVLLDGRERFNENGELDPERRPIRFVFLFNHFISRDIEVF